MSEWIIEVSDGVPNIKQMKQLVRCKDCEHLVSVNKNLIYAVCNKTNKVFHAFENYSSDTREFFCAYGERKETNDSR